MAAYSYCEGEKKPIQCLVTVSYSYPSTPSTSPHLPPPSPSYVAHSSAHRDGEIQLDYGEFLLLHARVFSNDLCTPVMRRNCEASFAASCWVMLGYRFVIILLLGSPPLCYCLLLGACFAVSSVPETLRISFEVPPQPQLFVTDTYGSLSSSSPKTEDLGDSTLPGLYCRFLCTPALFVCFLIKTSA